MADMKEHDECFDLVIIGGGINGAGIAADAAGRGLKVLLLEEKDFASGTSSASSKLIHGGLRYLEHYEFRLIREALGEREVLLKKAPHLVWPLRFALPLMPGMRPAWLIRIGLFLYDHLAKRVSLPGTKTVILADTADNMGFAKSMTKAFLYSDCWVDDARFVIANLLMAQHHGAKIHNYTKFVSANRQGDRWQVEVQNCSDESNFRVKTKAIINAAGPWCESVSDALGLHSRDFAIRRIKGSHIITPKLYEGDNACLVQLEDDRVLVIMPYEDDYTLIGTTDIEIDGEVRGIGISQEETDYLLKATNSYFQRQMTRNDVVWSYAGVRPLYEEVTASQSNPSKVTRDYAFRVDDNNGEAPVLTILGGKLTTYRRLAQHALGELAEYFPKMGNSLTDFEVLPGGDIGKDGQVGLIKTLCAEYPWLSPKTVKRFVRLYGSRSFELIADAKSLEDLGRIFGSDLTEREVQFLRQSEWASTAEDVLWRRTKLGLRMSEVERSDLDAYLTGDHQQVEQAHAPV